MSSLAGTTEKLRSIIRIGVLVAAALFAVYILIVVGIFIKEVLFPSALPLPEQAFGKLPPLRFEQSPPAGIQYLVNTSTGRLPADFPDRILVYKIEQPKPDLLALQNVRRMTSIAGFKDQETKISDTLYQWTNLSSNAIIQYDINTNNFEVRSNYLSAQNLLTNSGFPDEDRIKKNISEFLNSLQVNISSLSFSDNSLIYLIPSVNGLQKAQNPYDGKVVRVSLYNNAIENNSGTLPIVYPNPEYSILSFILSYPSPSRMFVLEGESYNHIISKEEFSDYPIKTAEEAYKDLESGNAYLYNPNDEKTIQITDVYLAYYLDKNTSDYLQPVVVFQGVNARAYVPALKELSDLSSEKPE